MAGYSSKHACIWLDSGIIVITATLLTVLLPEANSKVTTGIKMADIDGSVGSRSFGRSLLETRSILNCTPRSIDEFPDDFMSEDQRLAGGILFHILLTCYLFAATAMACDDYFVPSMKRIASACRLPPDVAGATFMAAGSSAPEFFTAVIGIWFAKSDIGLSTIVGSAILNLLFVNAVCGLFAGMVIYLTWWTTLRDCSVYAVSVLILIIIIYDGEVHWYESLAMLAAYVLYVVLMYFNDRLASCVKRKAKTQSDILDSDQSRRPLLPDHVISRKDLTTTDALVSKEKSGNYGTLTDTPSQEGKHQNEINSDDDDKYESLLKPPKGCCKRLFWIIMFPASSLMMLTIPDFRRGGCWEKFYPITFLLSITWIAGLCYVMVWMVTIIGSTFGVPDTIMGYTLLAIGSSVPDIIASYLVAKEGYGDMAVSNTVGSNVFDILVCLGLPLFIQTVIIRPNSVVLIASKGLTYSSITLFGSIVLLVTAFIVNKWRLTKLFGFGCLFIYLVVVTLSCLYELNIFGDFALPPCP